jgi:imidazolonepropionase-like amidohydrolase
LAEPHPISTTTPTKAPITALVDVQVLPIDRDILLEHQTLLIENGLIRQLGPMDKVVVPPGATVIPEAGKFIMPGMADMHVHLPAGKDSADFQRVLDLSLAHGVTVIRGMQGDPEHLKARARLREQNALVPELFLAGPPIAQALTVDQANAAVLETKAAGYDFIKVIGGLDRDAYGALVAKAKEAHIPVCGHVPAEIGIDAAITARQSSIEHVMGYGAAARQSESALDTLAQRTREAGVSNCPTLRYYAVSNEADVAALADREGMTYASKEKLAEWTKEKGAGPAAHDGGAMQVPRRIVAALARAGARILVGSDSPGAFSVPGFAYVEELRELERAGVAPYDVLRAATRSAAEYLGKESEFGSVAVGQRADLVVLDADPRASLDNLAHPAGVVLRGQWLPRDVLEKNLRAYAE